MVLDLKNLIPDSSLTKATQELVRDTENDLLFNHSSRVYLFGALAGKRKKLTFDAELLYVATLFHDMGLTPTYSTPHERFEVDSANAAARFLKSHHIAQAEIDMVWTAVALHTTPGIPCHMPPVIALTTAGVEMDVLGIDFDAYSDAERKAVVAAYPRDERFKADIIDAFYEGNKNKPATTFGNVNADVLADKDPHFRPINFCTLIKNSAWPG